jgi:hypothetical protein
MTTNTAITSWCLIRDNEIIYNNELIFKNTDSSFSNFFKEAYESLNINYPKFFKMDNLCKTGFLAAETLLRDKGLKEKQTSQEIAILFSNANSSLDTDILYQESTKTIASPALFVYTLPNVLVGELCIRHQIKGENACFVFDNFDPDFHTNYIEMLLNTDKAKTCISGWADFFNGKFEAFFYLVEGNNNTLPKHTSQNVLKLYKGYGTTN